MTKNQAQNAILEGKKVTHRTFSLHEFIELGPKNNLLDEKGYVLDWVDFWKYRTHENFGTDWKVFKES